MAKRPQKKKTVSAEPIIEKIIPTDITRVMEDSYRDYAAAVVIGRAIPDVRDGLKPVHRRILYAMLDGGYDWSKPHRKSARIVGDVIGKFHPHGDTAVYEAMARLTQPWSLTAPLIDGQGNFGSADGDNPAAMRYTEARMSQIAKHLVEDIRKGTVEFQPNYDGQEIEPTVMPAAFPNLLVNGGSGIAVGMASSIPTHNFKEIIQACRWRLKKPNGTLEQVMEIVGGPDFPTKGRIMGQGGIIKGYETGRGTFDLEARLNVGKDGRTPLLIYEDMPWGVNKTTILARISSLMLENKLPEVIGARDESDRVGTRFVVELKPDSDPEQVDARLKTLTDLRVSISINFTAIDGTGVPREMGILEILDRWISFREDVLRRRTMFELRKARDRGRLLFGRILALSIIDKVIALIRQSSSSAEAVEALMTLKFKKSDFEDLLELMGTEEQKTGKTFGITKTQAEDILAIRLARLTGLERDSLAKEGTECALEVARLSELLNTVGALIKLMDKELAELEKSETSIPRQTEISELVAKVVKGGAAAPEILLPKTPVYIHHYPDGSLGRSIKKSESDMPGVRVEDAHTHARLAFFSSKGTAYGLGVMDIPDLDDKKTEPRVLPGLLGISPDGEIIGTILVDQDREDVTLVFISQDGFARRTSLSEFSSIPGPGKVAMKITDKDAPLITVIEEFPGDADIMLATQKGKILRFGLDNVRIFSGRSSRGVRGMKLEADDHVVSGLLLPEGPDAAGADKSEVDWKNGKSEGPILVQLCTTGHAKRTPASAYRTMGRGGKGINDKGPAKTIGDVVCVIRIDTETDSLLWQDKNLWLAVSDVKRAGKASTGGKPLDDITTSPLRVSAPETQPEE
jgi:DNA gyrase subunit A